MEDFRLEIQPGGVAEIGMRRPRIAIDAAMFTTAVRIDRPRIAKIGRVDLIDHGAGGVVVKMRGELWSLVAAIQPAIIDQQAFQMFKTPGGAANRAAPMMKSRRKFVRHKKNITGTFTACKEQNKNILEIAGNVLTSAIFSSYRSISMRKIILAMAALGLLIAAPAYAAAPKPAATAQQQRMKTCAAEYNAKKAAGKIQKSQYRAFMKVCLKNPANAAKAPAPAAAPAPAPVTSMPAAEPYKSPK